MGKTPSILVGIGSFFGSAGSCTGGGDGNSGFVHQKLFVSSQLLGNRGGGSGGQGVRVAGIGRNSVNFRQNQIVFGSVGSWNVVAHGDIVG